MSESMYMKEQYIGESSINSSALSINDKLVDRVFDGKNEEADIRSTMDYDLNKGKTYATELGAPFSKSRKLTLRDLGRHMSERMLDAMSQENVNSFDLLQLGAPTNGKISNTDILSNIMLSVTNNIKKKNKRGDDSYTWDTSLSNDFNDNMRLRYGDYISTISDYKKYAQESYGLRMGEANVINPPFQFNEADDIRSDFRRPQIGRLYSEEIYDYNMPIVYFQPGTVKIDTAGIKMASAFVNQQSQKYQEYLRGEGGPAKWFAAKASSVAKTVISFGAKTVLDTVTWYKWTPEFNKYIGFANEMLIELASWMGLVSFTDSNEENLSQFQDNFNGLNKFTNENTTASEAFDGAEDENKRNKGNKENPLTGEETGTASFSTVDNIVVESRPGYLGTLDVDDHQGILSALHILPQFRKRITTKSSKSIDIKDNDERGVDAWKYADLTIPVAIDKGATSSESFSNSLMQHPLKEQYNRQFEDANQTRMSNPITDDPLATGLDGLASYGQQVMEYLKNSSANHLQNTLSQAGMSSEAGMVASGLGRFILPEVWSDSTYDKSYSISMKLRSPYGHRLSIYENEYVPISFFTCLSAPRKVGIQSYTNPFYVKVFCKGLFSVPMGMITSFSINKGEDSNDRTVEGFFRTTSISISIKDVLPDVAAGLDGGVFSVSKAGNMGMNNFIANLAGIDFIERANLLNIMGNNYKDFRTTLRAVDVFGFGEGNDGSTGRTNLMMKITGGGPLGSVISTTTKKFGLAKNPFKTSTPTSFY